MLKRIIMTDKQLKTLIDEAEIIRVKLEEALEKRYRPVMLKLIEDNDLDGIKKLANDMPEHTIFYIKVIGAFVEVKQKLKNE